MKESQSGLTIRSFDQPMETVSLTSSGLELRLIASGDGTEIIHHRLKAGSRWALYPADGWEALEFVYVLTGSLIWHSPSGDHVLRSGDSVSGEPVRDETIFIAETDCEFLYVASQPVFHHYSENAKELMRLAVDIEQKDGYTADHCYTIMRMAMMIGESMGLTSAQLMELNYGSFFHDIGKTRVPASILGKPGKLTSEEYEIMKTHAALGRSILNETGMTHLKAAGLIVEQHHERFDGSGYPYGLKGGSIHIGSAIVAVVDSYDAITAQRVYKEAVPKEQAWEEMERSRGKYHPDVMDAFFKLAHQL